jgi:hypothetical protein
MERHLDVCRRHRCPGEEVKTPFSADDHGESATIMQAIHARPVDAARDVLDGGSRMPECVLVRQCVVSLPTCRDVRDERGISVTPRNVQEIS